VNEAFRKQNEELINEKGLLKREFMLSAAEWTSDEEKFSQVKCLLKETQSKLDTATQEIRRLSKSLDSSQMELAKSQKDAAGLEDRLEITNFELQKFQVERRMFNKESETLKRELGVIVLDDEDRYESLENPPRVINSYQAKEVDSSGFGESQSMR
jgi:septal ring factor EnvC (AmiA/AmiB activator)